MSQTITLFGGSGFIGSHVADVLSEQGHRVRIFDRKTSPWLRPDQEMITGDLRDLEAVISAAKGCDTVFNFAGIADIGACDADPVKATEINVQGCVHTLEAALKGGARRYVFASTVYVYSDYGSFYRATKQACEALIETYQLERGLDYTILRFGTLYGRRADPANRVRRLLEEALETGKIDYKGDGDAEREFIHVRDAAVLTARILDEKYRNRRLVLTGQEKLKIRDLLRTIDELVPGGVKFKCAHTEPAGHYRITPYAYQPRVGHKLIPDDFVDLGQGLLDVIQEMADRNPEAAKRLDDAKRTRDEAVAPKRGRN